MSSIKNVTVLGSGVLGSQIAYQGAFFGFNVTSYDISDEIIANSRARYEGWVAAYKADGMPGAQDGGAERALESMTFTSDLAEAVKDADLIIEAVPEYLELKRETYQKLAQLAPEKTIFATNSSSLLPSAMVDATGRPDRFIALHFANNIWRMNVAEIMGTEATSKETWDAVVDYAKNSGMVPIEIHKEKAGYVLNSLLIPLLTSASELWVDGYASTETIDQTWRIATGAPMGPFQIYDVVGLNTAYALSSTRPTEVSQRFAAKLKEEYLDKGKLGVASGEGFYTYGQK